MAKSSPKPRYPGPFAPGVKRVRVSQERQFSAHNFLIHHAYLNLKARELSNAGSFHAELAVLVTSAFAIEALCNAVGPRIFDPWDDWKSPLSKMQRICEKLDIEYDETREPWSTLRWLSGFRNDIAHAKPELLTSERFCGPEEAEAIRNRMPLSAIEKQVTLGNAKRAYRAIKQARDMFCDALDVEDRFGISADAWTGHLSIEPEPTKPSRP